MESIRFSFELLDLAINLLRLAPERKRHLKAVSTSTLRVSKVMSITSSSGDHFDDRDRQSWKPQGAAELRA